MPRLVIALASYKDYADADIVRSVSTYLRNLTTKFGKTFGRPGDRFTRSPMVAIRYAAPKSVVNKLCGDFKHLWDLIVTLAGMMSLLQNPASKRRPNLADSCSEIRITS